ncbi:beta-1 adrenergic receptor-like [Exaiptasia diaphana]|uniref:G-protein coupled receptors family 1 profile domain-containing protein n=1 Tax=Exaiptasia diaphana TaxID=2652724 RepID=A0A913YEX1_EXADI|nr:beta-1 adrenergic receptor-like [Exaiptasia diaphana]
MLSGVANLCAVTYDRYVAVTQPFRYLGIMQKKYRYLLVSVWLVSATVAVLPILWKDQRHSRGHQIYVMAVQILFIGLPFIVIAIIYYRIYHHARKCNKVARCHSNTHVINTQFKSLKRTESEFKVACVFALVTVMFFLGWFPVIYYTSAFLFGHARSVPREITELSPITLALGSLGNPFVYSLVKPDFRKALRKLLGKQKKHVVKGSGSGPTSVSRMSQKKGRDSQEKSHEKNPKETNL